MIYQRKTMSTWVPAFRSIESELSWPKIRISFNLRILIQLACLNSQTCASRLFSVLFSHTKSIFGFAVIERAHLGIERMRVMVDISSLQSGLTFNELIFECSILTYYYYFHVG